MWWQRNDDRRATGKKRKGNHTQCVNTADFKCVPLCFVLSDS